MNELIGSTIIPIDKNGKYILKIPKLVDKRKQEKITKALYEWLDGPDPFAVISGDWEIIEIMGNDGRH